MVALDQFIAKQNIAHYRSRLQMGAEPETRAVLLKLLLDEEKELGRTREQLARIDKHIEKLRRIIAQQEKHIERFKFISLDTERATLLLATLNELMATYQLHRQWITAAPADGNRA
jgi:septal ring factor EnvC (AmiA/AmiB activator)